MRSRNSETPVTPAPKSVAEQLEAASVEARVLAVRRQQALDVIAEKEREVQSLARRAASGDEIARRRAHELVAFIDGVKTDVALADAALEVVSGRVNELTGLRNEEIQAEQAARLRERARGIEASLVDQLSTFFETSARLFEQSRLIDAKLDELRSREFSGLVGWPAISGAHEEGLRGLLSDLNVPLERFEEQRKALAAKLWPGAM